MSLKIYCAHPVLQLPAVCAVDVAELELYGNLIAGQMVSPRTGRSQVKRSTKELLYTAREEDFVEKMEMSLLQHRPPLNELIKMCILSSLGGNPLFILSYFILVLDKSLMTEITSACWVLSCRPWKIINVCGLVSGAQKAAANKSFAPFTTTPR